MKDISQLAAHRPPLRIGILGLGRAGLLRHLPQLRRLPELFRIAAVCDLLKERRDMVEREFPDARLYRQAADIIDDPDIEMLVVATPTLDHEAHAKASLAHGKWTVLESPISLTQDGASLLKAASQKARGRLIPYLPGLFSTTFHLARKAMTDKRLGEIYEIRICRTDWIRRDDWQSVKRCGGGAAWYGAPDSLHQAMALLGMPPTNLWSDLKRITSLGDAEDYVSLKLKTRGSITASIEINGGALPPYPPAIEIRGSMGYFRVEEGAESGILHVIDPSQQFARRRSSVRTPDIKDLHEELKTVDIPLSLDEDTNAGNGAFWISAYETVRTAQPFPVEIDTAIEAIRYLQLAKKSSPFAN